GDAFGLEALGPPLGRGGDDPELVQVLDGSPAALAQAGPPGDRDDRNPCGVGLGQPGKRVGEAGTGRDADGCQPSRGERPPLGHENGVLLMARVDQAEADLPGSLEQGKVVTTGEREQDLDAGFCQGPSGEYA